MRKSLNNAKDNDENGNKEATYVFEVQENDMYVDWMPKISTRLWQILPSACASLTCIPYGLMLGWPSPTYPFLTKPDSPITISMNQTALVAGFLMFGVCFGTIFSSKQIGYSAKYGIILGNLCTVLGWIIMWQAQDVYGLLGSRILMGAGHGYAMGQVKNYITEMTEEMLTAQLIKHIHFYSFSGFVIAYAMGPFIDFRLFSLISLIIAVFAFFLSIFLPCTPRELIRAKRIQDAKRLLVFLKPGIDPEQEAYNMVQNLSQPSQKKGFMSIIKDANLRTNFIKLTILIFCQQYCGAPPTLVYTQILFTESQVPYPEYIALGYAVLFFLSSFVGTYVSPRYNKKTVLLVSSCSVLALYISKILVIYFKINDEYFSYSSVIVMYLFIVSYTIGLGSIPFTLINDWFSGEYKEFVIKHFIIVFSILGLTITKIFQVLIGQFDIYVPYILFSGVIIFAIAFIIVFVPYNLSVENDSYKIGNIQNVELKQNNK